MAQLNIFPKIKVYLKHREHNLKLKNMYLIPNHFFFILKSTIRKKPKNIKW